MKRRSETEWVELIREQVESGQSQREWCRLKGINLYTFRDRKSTIEVRQRKATIKNELKEMEWIKVTEVPGNDPESGWIEVTIGRFGIRVRKDFNETEFSRVCESLMRIC